MNLTEIHSDLKKWNRVIPAQAGIQSFRVQYNALSGFLLEQE